MSTPPEKVPFPDPAGDEHGHAWSPPVEALHLEGVPKEAVNLNVEGRRLSSLLGGFGQL